MNGKPITHIIKSHIAFLVQLPLVLVLVPLVVQPPRHRSCRSRVSYQHRHRPSWGQNAKPLKPLVSELCGVVLEVLEVLEVWAVLDVVEVL